MHDETSLTVGRALRVLQERVVPAVHAVSQPLQVAASELPGEPIPPAAAFELDYADYQVGTPWGPPWRTTWFRLRGTIPPQWRGRRVEALLDLGFERNKPGFQCEGLVYGADGQPIKSVNPRNQWVPVAIEATGGESVELYLEAAANPVILEDHPFLPTTEGDLATASTRPLYTTRRLDLAVFDAGTFELALDLEVLLELQAELPTASPRRMRILQAIDDALDRLDLQRIDQTAAAAREALATVLGSPAEASAHRIAAIGHSHIDSAWLWPVRETIRKVARTAASMTQLISEYPEFRYGMSSAQQYAWLKVHRPEVYAEVKRAVADGRFLPLGGMWVESDTVMPTGEALVRQFSYGQRFFREEFGVRCRGVWLPDSFGYSPALPQLIRRAGFEWFFTQKISWNQVNRFPHHTFLWEGIDGSRIFTHFPPMDTYNSQLSGAELARATRQFRENRVATTSLAPVGWGDGGGGTTREMIGRARRLADLEGSARVSWQHPDDFFAAARAELSSAAVWVGELYLELHRATLTSQHQTKQGNRRSEQLLIEAELWSATASVRTGFDYPYDQLDALWRQVLLMQFHDILPGTSIAWVHREAVASYARVEQELEALIDRALRALVGVGERPVAVNPGAFDRDGVPALAAAVSPPAPGGSSTITASGASGGYVLANELVEIHLDADGLIIAAIDRGSGQNAIVEGAHGNLLQLHQDFPNMWDAWDVDRFYRNTVTDLRAVDRLEPIMDSDGARLVVERRFSSSRIRQTLSLAPGERVLQIEQEVDWHETEKFLKVAFPFAIHAEHTAAETQFGYQRRVTHTNTTWEAAKFETSMHRYVHVAEPGFGATLITDSTYGYDVSRDADPDRGVSTTVRLSVLRAPRFPDPETDQGRQTGRFGLVVGSTMTDAVRAGVLLNARARTVAGGQGFDPLARVVGPGLVISAVKLADDRSGAVVVRIYESLGARTAGQVIIDHAGATVTEVSLLEDRLGDVDVTTENGRTIAPVRLTAFEVRTLRFDLAAP